MISQDDHVVGQTAPDSLATSQYGSLSLSRSKADFHKRYTRCSPISDKRSCPPAAGYAKRSICIWQLHCAMCKCTEITGTCCLASGYYPGPGNITRIRPKIVQKYRPGTP